MRHRRTDSLELDVADYDDLVARYTEIGRLARSRQGVNDAALSAGIESISPNRRRHGDRRANPEDAVGAGARMLGPALLIAVLSVLWFSIGYWCRS